MRPQECNAGGIKKEGLPRAWMTRSGACGYMKADGVS